MTSLNNLDEKIKYKLHITCKESLDKILTSMLFGRKFKKKCKYSVDQNNILLSILIDEIFL